MRSFLLGETISTATKNLMSQNEDKWIIVETNFRVYCYTASGLYRSILDLFSRVEIVFPNFIGGQITREKVREAFQKGITADQIAMFLNKHAHEQMYIKKELDDEKEAPKGTLVDYQDDTYYRKSKKGGNVEVSVIPKNVIDQMHIWEEEVNCIRSQEGVMISNFESKDKFDYFKAFMKDNFISPLGISDKNMIVVVPLENEKAIYEFLNKH